MIPAEILRNWRAAATQKQAALALSVPLRTYQGWEAGRSIPQATLGPLLIAIRHIQPA